MGRYTSDITKKINRDTFRLHAKGYGPTEIAKELKVAPSSIYRIMKSEKFTRVLEGAQKDVVDEVRKIFLGKAKRCARKIVDIAEDGKPEQRLQYDAAKEILYQIGAKPIEITETRERQFSQQELETALVTLKEVQAIADRLEGGTNRFVIDEAKEEAPASDELPPCSPLPPETASSPTTSDLQNVPTVDAKPS